MLYICPVAFKFSRAASYLAGSQAMYIDQGAQTIFL